MTARPAVAARAPLVTAAAVAAVAGMLAVVSGSGGFAVLAGAASVAAAWLAVRRPVPRPGEPPPEVEGPGVEVARTRAVEERDGAEQRVVPARVETPAPVEAPGPFDLTGLLSEEILGTMLHGRVAVARRALRPLSLLYFEAFELGDVTGTRPVGARAVAGVVGETLRDSDTAARVADGCYVCILEDTGEDGAMWTAERLRRNLADSDPGRRFRAGIAAYPNHSLEAAELQAKAWAALEAARAWSQDRIEVAVNG